MRPRDNYSFKCASLALMDIYCDQGIEIDAVVAIFCHL